MSDGFVVASVGWNFLMLSKSPVSATTVVYCLNSFKYDIVYDFYLVEINLKA